MWSKNYKLKNTFVGRYAHEEDLFTALSEFCIEKEIKVGQISIIGAIKNLKVGYFDQKEKKYTYLEFNNEHPFEIIHCGGNISLKEGKPFPHVHIVASDREGNCYGGHLMPGVKVFAGEFVIQEFEGEELIREIDSETRLPLWKLN